MRYLLLTEEICAYKRTNVVRPCSMIGPDPNRPKIFYRKEAA
jgi:hypothetical protein